MARLASGSLFAALAGLLVAVTATPPQPQPELGTFAEPVIMGKSGAKSSGGGAKATPTPVYRRLKDGQIAWPPTKDPGPPRGGSPVVSYDSHGRALPVTSDIIIPGPGGQQLYVKDSRGQAALPGPNIWVGTPDFIWSDDWGLHLNIRPRNGCNDWASSEAW